MDKLVDVLGTKEIVYGTTTNPGETPNWGAFKTDRIDIVLPIPALNK